MMRKFLLAVILIISLSPLSALEDLYLAPYGGSINVNLDTPSWTEVTSAQSTPFQAENRLVTVGALQRLNWNTPLSDNREEATKYGLKITITSPSERDGYFWFTSQSNPDSQRPFYLQIAGQFRPTGISVSDVPRIWGTFPRDGEESSIVANNDVISDCWDSWPFSSVYTLSIIPDIGIVLPGDIVNGVLTIEGSQSATGGREQYTIVSGDDYSCEINVRFEIVDSSGNPVTSVPGYGGPYSVELNIPFSGFYDPLLQGGNGSIPSELSSALTVHTRPEAANIDLRNQQGDSIHIADISYAVYNLPKLGDSGTYDDSIFIFLSANPNPYVPNDDGFQFVHEDVAPGVAPGPRQRIGYTVTVRADANTEAGGGTAEETFIGDEYLTVEGAVGQVVPDDRKLTTACNEEDMGLAVEKYNHWHSYAGELWLNLLPNTEAPVMNAGYYRSYIYVHAIVDESAGG